MKSFCLYLREPKTPPKRYVTEIPPEEQKRLQEAFQQSARQYRRNRRIAGIVFALSFGSLLFSFALPKAYFPWAIGAFIACWVIVVGAAIFSPPLRCPACQNKVEDGFGPFCPECGTYALQSGTWFRAPRCSACNREMRHRKTRHYTVRACTHCGVWLDDKGV